MRFPLKLYICVFFLNVSFCFNEISLELIWSIIALPCSVSFCCTRKWISYMCTHICSLLSLPQPQPTPLGHHRALSWAPCAIEQVHISCPEMHEIHSQELLKAIYWKSSISPQFIPHFSILLPAPVSARLLISSSKIFLLKRTSSYKHCGETIKGMSSKGLPWRLSGQESSCSSGRCMFYPWVREIPWRRKWKPTPVFLPGEPHGQRSLVGYSPWGHKGSDMT